jgi:hypothetical protein
MRHKSLSVLGIALLFTVVGCGKKEEPASTVTQEPSRPADPVTSSGVTAGSITLGKSVGSDKKVSAPAETFGKRDTIYASVETMGTGTATLKATWTYLQGGESKIVNEESRTIDATGPATTEFHITKPDGWPAGDYRVEFMLDDKSIGTKEFKVA